MMKRQINWPSSSFRPTATTKFAIERLFRLSEKRADFLSESALKFIATSDHLSQTLETDLDWSSATIGLCKAVETEVINRIVIPLSILMKGVDLTADLEDKDIGRIVRSLSSSAKFPGLGTFCHFLRTSLNSKNRRAISPVIDGFHRLLSSWPNSAWLSNDAGLLGSLIRLTRDFRNRAAHADVLSRQDYEACRKFVIGADGVLWKLIAATEK